MRTFEIISSELSIRLKSRRGSDFRARRAALDLLMRLHHLLISGILIVIIFFLVLLLLTWLRTLRLLLPTAQIVEQVEYGNDGGRTEKSDEYRDDNLADFIVRGRRFLEFLIFLFMCFIEHAK